MTEKELEEAADKLLSHPMSSPGVLLAQSSGVRFVGEYLPDFINKSTLIAREHLRLRIKHDHLQLAASKAWAVMHDLQRIARVSPEFQKYKELGLSFVNAMNELQSALDKS